jgi:hypothetical protein
MVFGDKPAIITKKSSFTDMVDDACDRLMEKQVEFSILRIRQMEERLNALEQELDEFLAQKA